MHLPKRAGLPRLLVLGAVLVAGAFAIPATFGSSHREAPGTALDPAADDTDLYAYTAKDAPGSLTLVGDWIPFEDPAGGPNFYRFDDRAHYYFNIDNTGDGKADIRYRFKFLTHYRNRKSFIYALPGVNSIRSKNLLVFQTYSISRENLRNGRLRSAHVVASNLTVAPNNAGTKTFPNYDAVANQAIRKLNGGLKVFAGPREDPFFVDLGTTFDAINFRVGTGNAGGGRDDVAGYNVHSIVLQLPESKVTRNAKAVSGPGASNAVVGVWASTERPRLQVSNDTSKSSGKSVQVSRLGNPLINEVVIPVGLKDKFNRTKPDMDAANYASYVLNPEVAAVANALFHIGAPEHNRTDIVNALLVGLPGKTKISPNAVPADTLKVNLGVPPAAVENRFGLIGGDLAGFPDGRRLGDDVVDIELRVIAGALVGHNVPLGDGVDQNDKPFMTTFPYLAPPANGFDGSSTPKRVEPGHPPTP